MNNRNYAQLFAICKKNGFDYKDKVAEFTKGLTDSLKSLSDAQYHEFMLQMQKINQPFRKSFTPKPGDAQRKKMIAIARQMRWDIKSDKTMMQRIDNFCTERGAYKKPLMQHTSEELNKVLYIFEMQVLKDFLKTV